jgi:Winged helix DNA-binding domain
MTKDEQGLIRHRLAGQQLVASRFRSPVDVVAWLGAVQSQDYAGATWGLGMRTPGIREGDVDRLFDQGAILRTHVLRPTWHFVAPPDIRWMLALTAPRVLATCASYYRTFELDAPLLTRSRRVLERVLRDRAFKTRAEIATALGGGGVEATGVRLGFLVMDAELHGLICSGPRRGKKFTYALMDERIAPSHTRRRDEALVELAARYFTSHGPATLRDFSWWSGLLTKDGQRGVDGAGRALTRETLGGRTYWRSPGSMPADPLDEAYLLANYDEYLIAYKDRDLVVPNAAERRDSARPASEVLSHHIVLGGRLAGAWRRTKARTRMMVDGRVDRPLTAKERRALARAASRYAEFLGQPVDLRIETAPAF